jgi:peptidoglycan/LPS O-acetylase OafA/YrhL
VVADLLLFGWAGVFIFFPISGYCIAAATERADGIGAIDFMRRRWRRIFPPYWASMLVAVAVGAAALAFNRGTAGDLVPDNAVTWIAALTLTQTFVGADGVVNPVYWSLCYEEQFYLVMAAGLFLARGYRWCLWAGVSVLAAIYVSAESLTTGVPGLFLQHWLEFALGVSAFVWLHRPAERRWAIVTLAAATVALCSVGDYLPLAISVVTSAAMIGLQPHQSRLFGRRVVRWLARIGPFSFSLYLVHVPVGGRVVNLFRRVSGEPDAALWITPLAVAVSVAAAWAFYVLVERRFLNQRAGVPAAAPISVPA